MTLIKSISGIRGTIGGRADEGLTPLDVVKLTSAYAALIRKTTTKTSNKIVVGRDAQLFPAAEAQIGAVGAAAGRTNCTDLGFSWRGRGAHPRSRWR